MRTGMAGYVMMMTGAVLFGGGLGISFTGIGACLGIPAMFVGLPLVVIGAIKYRRARSARIDAIIAHGVATSVARGMTHLTDESRQCSSCGQQTLATANFCTSCGSRREGSP